MKKTFLLLAMTGLLVASCGDEKKEEDSEKDSKENTEEKVSDDEKLPESEDKESSAPTLELNGSIDLSSIEIPLTITVPEGTEIKDESFATYVTHSEGFSYEVIEDDGSLYSLEERKEEWNDNDVNVVQSYVVDEPNGFIAETKVMGKIEYHFFYVLEGEEMNYYFENEKGYSYSLEQAKLMFESVKTAQITEMEEME